MPSDLYLFGPLQSTWLADHLLETPTRSRLSRPVYTPLKPISSMPRQGVDGDYMQVWCVSSCVTYEGQPQ